MPFLASLLRFAALAAVGFCVTACSALSRDDARDLAVMKPITPRDPASVSVASGPVYYLTDRTFNTDRVHNPAIFSEDWSNSLACGVEAVAFPVEERLGSGRGPWKTLPAPPGPLKASLMPDGVPLAPLILPNDPTTYGPLVCDGSKGEPAAAIAKTIADNAKQLNCDHVLLFVHGFNNAFETALITAGRLAHDSNWACPVVTFDWTSAGAVLQYVDDVERSSFAQQRLAEFIGALSDTHAFGSIDVVAHSMGCRVVSATLSALQRRANPLNPGFVDQLIFAAPDIALADFERLEPDATRIARRLTVYASTGDVAVEASSFVHDVQDRAGNNPSKLAEWGIGDHGALDIVDASHTSGDVYGHVYLTGSKMAAADIARALRGETMEQRLQPSDPWPQTLTCVDLDQRRALCGTGTTRKSYHLVADPGGESWQSRFVQWLSRR